jgi:single-stranded DNA-binding protein
MLYTRKALFNKVFIHGFISDLIQNDKKNNSIKLLIETSETKNVPENVLEVFVYRKSIIESCEQWFKIGANVIIDGSIKISLSKSVDNKNVHFKRQYIRVDRIFVIDTGDEFY